MLNKDKVESFNFFLYHFISLYCFLLQLSVKIDLRLLLKTKIINKASNKIFDYSK